ncbi:phosphate ABC transporter permease subunit PstC [Fontimonas sp. SYSU GA230001]|uniref:phosphate ABC transporter permease subunit PstC n=1 Tax=Fontimonas sp. SYSU GA230001 TaxID=3142450 RepID=UPI0032B49095
MFRWNPDRVLAVGLRLCAAGAAAIVLLIAAFVVVESWPALRHLGIGRFVTDPSWHPTARAAQGTFDLLPMVWGTLWATAGAVLLATPLGVLSALFVHHYAARLAARVYRRMIELLAGIPSVVYGFWGLVVLVPLIRALYPPGPSLLAGILILTLMILPTIALMADAAIAAVPAAQLRAAAALGLSRGRTVVGVVLPAARSGLLTGVVLGTGRAIGETMAVLMVCGNVVQTPDSLFDPVRTLAANIALEMAYALGDHRSALFVSGLVLLALIAALTAIAAHLRPQAVAHA